MQSYTSWLKSNIPPPHFFSTVAFFPIQYCFSKRLELSYDSIHYEIWRNAVDVIFTDLVLHSAGTSGAQEETG